MGGNADTELLTSSPCIEKVETGLYRCVNQGFIIRTTALPIHCCCPQSMGVGDNLGTKIGKHFGAKSLDCSRGCREWIAMMNEWGPAGCREHREEIIDRMIEQAKKRDWKRENKSLVVNCVTRLCAKTSWGEAYARKMCGELVDEAISMAESAAADTMSTNPQ